MDRNSYLLTNICLLAMFWMLGLQFYWISKYYNVTRYQFEKEVNMAYEDALKKEFEIRCDTIEKKLVARLLDTNFYRLTSKVDGADKEVIYTISSVTKPGDAFTSSISIASINEVFKPGSRELEAKVAKHYAEMIRSEDLENHIIYYRSQTLGEYLNEFTVEMQFDTARLRPILNKYLAARDIAIDYRFYSAKADSTTYANNFPHQVLKKYPVITRALPTYSTQGFIRVMFTDPIAYILNEMWILLISSVGLVALIAFCLSVLLRSLRKEKRLSAIKNDFISNITHEFKTPIATAKLAVEALADDNINADREKRTRYLQHAGAELNRINLLTDKILKLSMFESNTGHLKKELLLFEPIVKELINIHKLHAGKATFNFEHTSEVGYLRADRIQFQHALSNVIENAVKYGPENVQINIACSILNHHLVITVKDNGVGIPPDALPYVFDKFYRVKTNAQQTKGYGLGLNYVRQIMEYHNGWYKISSDSKGTKLTLGWPL